MTIQNIQAGNSQNTELYKIRKQSETQESQQTEQALHEVQQADEYDKANPVGEEAEGIYRVSHDDEGNLKVDYKQPAPKSEAQPEGTGNASAGEVTSSTDELEEEIERLKKQRNELQAQLNRDTDEEAKKTLRLQIQNIETQIAQKTSELK